MKALDCSDFDENAKRELSLVLRTRRVPHASVLRVGVCARFINPVGRKICKCRKIPTRKPDVWGTPQSFR
jgi:hypothetical protein